MDQIFFLLHGTCNGSMVFTIRKKRSADAMVQQCLGFGNGSNKTSIGFPESQRDWST